jgi:hypothetical protein
VLLVAWAVSLCEAATFAAGTPDHCDSSDIAEGGFRCHSAIICRSTRGPDDAVPNAGRLDVSALLTLHEHIWSEPARPLADDLSCNPRGPDGV